ncbi:hypothetical protein B0H16DRAFT_1716391 [Mycena metata]|uniref:Uncharacterized protein n=1 Tax=Mycena metata TaxID=1033252 RepID=A0AAD7JN79_9AGAR|nr:hypothetical protein B0H16DRAFT_315742 [Mycena metata]KAJ7768383.1 hypothetical protein B0H16DRAFT_1716391 [Mycena metata]
MSDKLVKLVMTESTKGNLWKKFAKPTVERGKTLFPKKAADQEKYGIRFDYGTAFTQEDGSVVHTFKMQPNAGKIPSSLAEWRDKNGGTHAVMATVYVKEESTKEDVETALEVARQAFKDSRTS